MGKKSVRSYLHGQMEGIYHKLGKGIGESRHELFSPRTGKWAA